MGLPRARPQTQCLLESRRWQELPGGRPGVSPVRCAAATRSVSRSHDCRAGPHGHSIPRPVRRRRPWRNAGSPKSPRAVRTPTGRDTRPRCRSHWRSGSCSPAPTWEIWFLTHSQGGHHSGRRRAPRKACRRDSAGRSLRGDGRTATEGPRVSIRRSVRFAPSAERRVCPDTRPSPAHLPTATLRDVANRSGSDLRQPLSSTACCSTKASATGATARTGMIVRDHQIDLGPAGHWINPGQNRRSGTTSAHACARARPRGGR